MSDDDDFEHDIVHHHGSSKDYINICYTSLFIHT